MFWQSQYAGIIALYIGHQRGHPKATNSHAICLPGQRADKTESPLHIKTKNTHLQAVSQMSTAISKTMQLSLIDVGQLFEGTR